MSKERRTLPRYLCTEHFSESSLRIEGNSFILMSINFNRSGIALFTDKMLPQQNNARISFEFTDGKSILKISELPCIIRHRHETEVGHQYGIQFELIQPSADSMKEQLHNIELALAKNANDEDRYGLHNL